MIYKNNPKTTGNCLCLENFVLYKIYKKIESTKDTLYIALVISKKLCTELCGNGRRRYMRTIINLNTGWKFINHDVGLVDCDPVDWQDVTLPHTWNAIDGMDGNGSYDRGSYWYARTFETPKEQAAGGKTYVEVLAAGQQATVYVNGAEVTYHEGGYSVFRADITDFLKEDEENLLVINCSNEYKDSVYPQSADFTVLYSIQDKDGREAAYGCRPADDTAVTLYVPDAELWEIDEPYLYTVTATLQRRNEAYDEISVKAGVRSFSCSPEKGFIFNGKETPLRGVSRHQDKLYKGNALTREEHYQDAKIIKEIGANTIRLAHYQHSQDFYDACDEMGFIVWAEIPFISVFNKAPAAHQNCISQLKELIIQNYNHPSICF